MISKELNINRLCKEQSANIALLLDTAPLLHMTPYGAFKKSRRTFFTASYAGSATNDEGKGDGGGLELSI
jgi:hypothetical protein